METLAIIKQLLIKYLLNRIFNITSVINSWFTTLMSMPAPAKKQDQSRSIITEIELTGTQRVVATLVMTDLVDSTQLVERLGDKNAAHVIRDHDRRARDLLQRLGGIEIDKSDGFLFYFLNQNAALNFALSYQRLLAQIRLHTQLPIYSRIGIHYGNVVTYWNTEEDVRRGAKKLEIEGLAKLVTARLMSLAGSNQILLSGTAYDVIYRPFCDQYTKDYEQLSWLSYGQYKLKGVDSEYYVYEVGEPGLALLKLPRNAEKAKRIKTGIMKPVNLVFIGFLLVVALLTTGFLLKSKTTEKGYIVLGQFKNETSNPLFDDSLPGALKIGFQQSTFTSIVSDQRIFNTLGLMQKPVDSVLDRKIGIEVSKREEAKALILGNVSELNGGYLLALDIIDPLTGITMFSDTRQVDTEDNILESLDSLIVNLREELGESLPFSEDTNLPLAKVTTPNLEALKAYTLGIDEYGKARFEQARQLFELAVQEDPDFAMAWASLGVIELQVASRDPKSALKLMEKALTYKDRLSKRETLYLEGSMNWYGRPEDMARSWFLLSSIYSDMMAGHQNLGIVKRSYFNDFDEAVRAFTRATKLSTDSRVAISYQDLAYAYLALNKYPESLQAFEKSWQIGQPVNPVHGGLVDILTVLGRFQEAEDFVNNFSEQVRPDIRQKSLLRLADHYLYRGQLEESFKRFLKVEQASFDNSTLSSYYRAKVAKVALLELQQPQSELFRNMLIDVVNVGKEQLAATSVEGMSLHHTIHLAFLGIIAARNDLIELALEIKQVLENSPEKVEKVSLSTAYYNILKGELLISEGNYDQALELIRPYANTKDSQLEIFQAHESLARLFTKSGEIDKAIREYQWISNNKGRAFAEWIDEFYGRQFNIISWCVSQYKLAKLYLLKEDFSNGKKAFQNFINHWQEIDVDLAIINESREKLNELDN